MHHVDVLIVGGGQAGLSTAYQLQKTQHSFLVVEKLDRIGDQWRNRYDSLVLFATRRYSHIPGLKMQGDQAGYPCKNEVADYLENYAKHFRFPVKTATQITQVKQHGNGYVATLNDEEQIHCYAIVVATGGFQVPNVPAFANLLDDNVAQFTPDNYQRPSQLPEGPVLIVGDGATGRQVAKEIVKTHETVLATGQKRKIKPQQIFGKDYFWWLDKLGILRVSKNSLFGKYMIKHPPFPGQKLKDKDLKREGVNLAPRLVDMHGNTAYFSDGTQQKISSVIWSLGYHFNYDWLQVDGTVDQRGEFEEERGISPIRGLYSIGKPWQWTRGSSTLTGVGADAAYISENMNTYLHQVKQTAPERNGLACYIQQFFSELAD